MLLLARGLVEIGREALGELEPVARIGRKLAQYAVEVGGIPEVAVDRGETHVGDGIELAQRRHDKLADLGRGYLGFTRALELAHETRDEPVDALRLDRPLAQGDRDRFRKLVAVEEHLASGTL